jgi:hypothetical protein
MLQQVYHLIFAPKTCQHRWLRLRTMASPALLCPRQPLLSALQCRLRRDHQHLEAGHFSLFLIEHGATERLSGL